MGESKGKLVNSHLHGLVTGLSTDVQGMVAIVSSLLSKSHTNSFWLLKLNHRRKGEDSGNNFNRTKSTASTNLRFWQPGFLGHSFLVSLRLGQWAMKVSAGHLLRADV